MKTIVSYISALMLLLVGDSCKKDNSAPVGGASLAIINAVVGSNSLVTNFSNNYELKSYYLYANALDYGSYNSFNYEFGLSPGNAVLTLYQYPDTTAKSTPLYKLNLNMTEGGIYSLFLTGEVASPDTLFITDHPPYHPPSDSSVGVRFVNLSPGSNPVNITLSTSDTVNEFSGISYKSITAFKNYPAIASIPSYLFQFRDAVTGTILGTFKMNGINNGAVNTSNNIYRFRNVTIALKGVPGGTGTFLINNY